MQMAKSTSKTFTVRCLYCAGRSQLLCTLDKLRNVCFAILNQSQSLQVLTGNYVCRSFKSLGIYLFLQGSEKKKILINKIKSVISGIVITSNKGIGLLNDK